MFHFIAWIFGKRKLASFLNALQTVILTLFGFPQICSFSMVSFLIYDLSYWRKDSYSENIHHIIGLITIYFICGEPSFHSDASRVMALVEFSTLFLNLYHNSKAEKPDLNYLIYPKIWSLCFPISFIICRMFLLEIVLVNHYHLRWIYWISYFWYGLNTYWLYWMAKKFIFNPYRQYLPEFPSPISKLKSLALRKMLKAKI